MLESFTIHTKSQWNQNSLMLLSMIIYFRSFKDNVRVHPTLVIDLATKIQSIIVKRNFTKILEKQTQLSRLFYNETIKPKIFSCFYAALCCAWNWPEIMFKKTKKKSTIEGWWRAPASTWRMDFNSRCHTFKIPNPLLLSVTYFSLFFEKLS